MSSDPSQAGGIEQGYELALRTLPATRHDQHVHVHHRDQLIFDGAFDRFRHQALDHQQTAARRHSPAATLENGDALPIVPIVDDVLENVDVGSERYGLEEIPLDDIASLHES